MFHEVKPDQTRGDIKISNSEPKICHQVKPNQAEEIIKCFTKLNPIRSKSY
jgi:hypothetical protein